MFTRSLLAVSLEALPGSQWRHSHVKRSRIILALRISPGDYVVKRLQFLATAAMRVQFWETFFTLLELTPPPHWTRQRLFLFYFRFCLDICHYCLDPGTLHNPAVSSLPAEGRKHFQKENHVYTCSVITFGRYSHCRHFWIPGILISESEFITSESAFSRDTKSRLVLPVVSPTRLPQWRPLICSLVIN